MGVSIDSAIAAIRANPKPVLYLDTCAVLDLIRTLPRENPKSTSVQAAQECVSRVRGGELHVINLDIVATEWASNVANVLEEGLAALRRTNALLARARSVSPLVSVPVSSVDVPVDLMHSLRQVGEDLLAASMTVDSDDARTLLAMKRSMEARAPSSRGKAEPKDCAIIEHYLAIAGQISGMGVRQVFVSSNTADYGGGRSVLVASLNAEFQGVGLRWCGDLAWAVAKLDGRA